ncbi:MAG: hypothetical protein Q9165_004251 [Trypethelium subeluteriae]
MADQHISHSNQKFASANEASPDATSSPRRALQRHCPKYPSLSSTFSNRNTPSTSSTPSSPRANPVRLWPNQTSPASSTTRPQIPHVARKLAILSAERENTGDLPESFPQSFPTVFSEPVAFGHDYYAAFDPVTSTLEDWCEARLSTLIPKNLEQNPFDEAEYVRFGLAYYPEGDLVKKLHDCQGVRDGKCLSGYESPWAKGKGKGRILMVRWRHPELDSTGQKMHSWQPKRRVCIPCLRALINGPEKLEVQFRRGLHAYLMAPANGKEMHPCGKPVTDEDRARRKRKDKTVMEMDQANDVLTEDIVHKDPRKRLKDEDGDEHREAIVEGEGLTLKQGKHMMVTRAKAQRALTLQKRTKGDEDAERKRRKLQ